MDLLKVSLIRLLQRFSRVCCLRRRVFATKLVSSEDNYSKISGARAMSIICVLNCMFIGKVGSRIDCLPSPLMKVV